MPDFWEFSEGTYRLVDFFMLSCLILKCSVHRGIPSLTAVLKTLDRRLGRQ
jgi:hypothetical protein